MAIRKIKPTTPGQRFMTVSAFEEITSTTPERSLLEDLKSSGGRNNSGRITVRHRGGGAKRKYRVIDFKRNKDGIPAKVATIEYDPNRSANIALLHYADGEKRYIIAPLGLCVGDTLLSGEGADIKVGNALTIGSIPVGHNDPLHRVEEREGRAACAERRQQRAAHGERGKICAGEAAERRSALDTDQCQGDDRAGRECGPREHQAGQSGPEAS